MEAATTQQKNGQSGWRTVLSAVLKWAWRSLILLIIFFNVRLYNPSPLPRRSDRKPPVLLAQLSANRAALDARAATEMQQFFPEGYYFSYLFHGLTWVELGRRNEDHSEQAIEEARWCLEKLNSPAGKAPFPSELPPDHGMFYSAWKCSLRAGVVMLQRGVDVAELGRLQQECDALATAIRRSPTPYLASYRGAAWPCDTVPAIHALAAYDHITGEERYAIVIQAWLQAASERLDEETGLLPHTADLPAGREVGLARATSQVIMLRYLPDIDPDFAKQQYERYRHRF